jgi:hypothetical protein
MRKVLGYSEAKRVQGKTKKTPCGGCGGKKPLPASTRKPRLVVKVTSKKSPLGSE